MDCVRETSARSERAKQVGLRLAGPRQNEGPRANRPVRQGTALAESFVWLFFVLVTLR